MQNKSKDWQLVNGMVILNLKLMAVDLKKEIIVITDSNLGNVFTHKYPHQPPPIPKMKGSRYFYSVTSDELCSSDNSTVTELLSNHYEST